MGFGPLKFHCQWGTQDSLYFFLSLFLRVQVENDGRVRVLGLGHSALCVVSIKPLVHWQLWTSFWKFP